MGLIGDAIKLASLNDLPYKGLFVIGFEHNSARITLDPLLESFESIAKGIMKVHLDERIEEMREGLVHSEHQVLRCIGWQLWP